MRLGMQFNVCPQMLQRLFSSTPFDVVELEGIAKKPSARRYSGGTAGKKSVPQTRLHRYPLPTMLPHERIVVSALLKNQEQKLPVQVVVHGQVSSASNQCRLSSIEKLLEFFGVASAMKGRPTGAGQNYGDPLPD
ncbi:hypothetical protein PISMIDRAFT_681359, partial [Pisolithus microcarpus 441]